MRECRSVDRVIAKNHPLAAEQLGQIPPFEHRSQHRDVRFIHQAEPALADLLNHLLDVIVQPESHDDDTSALVKVDACQQFGCFLFWIKSAGELARLLVDRDGCRPVALRRGGPLQVGGLRVSHTIGQIAVGLAQQREITGQRVGVGQCHMVSYRA